MEIGTGKDRVVWTLSADIIFFVKSLFRKLIAEDFNFPPKFFVETEVPAKIKVFLWLVNRKSILTRDSLLKRNGRGVKNVFSVRKKKP